MKLFMEINPQLFDECSDHYRENEATAAQTLQNRTAKWNTVAEWARQRSNGGEVAAIPPLTDLRGQKFNPQSRIDEDPITQDSQKRLDALRLQDESGVSRDGRRQRGFNGQGQVSTRHIATPYIFLRRAELTQLVTAHRRPSNPNPPTARTQRLERKRTTPSYIEARDALERPSSWVIQRTRWKEKKCFTLSIGFSAMGLE